MWTIRKSLLLTCRVIVVVLVTGFSVHAEPPDDSISFNRDIRPILSDVCFQCHGPDVKERKADLRLDRDDQLFVERDSRRVLVAGHPAKSELFRRLTSTDDDQLMPPPSSGKKLTPQQVETIRRWIEQGAKYQGHWAFIPPTRPRVPPMADIKFHPPRRIKSEVSNPIDTFVLARLNQEGLPPSPPASKATLLRRVTLDLTGLPPSLDEIAEFLSDDSPDAYERVVDRLLASPRFGERFARPWLDAARYADTSGYQSDGDRSMWRWRDWVIEAFNDNKPFDEFTIEQLAGDLLPKPTMDQVLATGFNRNHRGNAEGGIIPEEYAVEYVVDRVDTTATVWLGLTLGCSRCHDHKFDPFSQREYYQLFSFFNNVPEKGRAIKFGNSPPFVKTPTREQQRQLDDFDARIAAAEQQTRKQKLALRREQAAWEKSLIGQPPVDWTVTRGEILRLPFDEDGRPKPSRPAEVVTSSRAQPQPLGPTSGAPVVKPADQVPLVLGEGRFGKGAHFNGQRRFAVGDVANVGFFEPFSISVWIRAEADTGTILSRMSDDANSDGYNLCLENGKLQFNLCKRWLDDAMRVETAGVIPIREWVHIAMTYDGSRTAAGVRFWINGEQARNKILLDELNQAFASKDLFRVGAGGLTPPFQGVIDDVRLFGVELSEGEVSILATPESVADLVINADEPRTIGQMLKLTSAYLAAHPTADSCRPFVELPRLHLERAAFLETVPTTMVMQELSTPRQSHVLIRGAYDRPGEEVFPGVPVSLGSGFANHFPTDPILPLIRGRRRNPPDDLRLSDPNRLHLARWLVDSANPLTARVTVNRFWQQIFGQGLVKTVDDFGSQGDWPTHPELLDWLAIEFAGPTSPTSPTSPTGPTSPAESREPKADSRDPLFLNWNIKRIIRELVTSATYRQSSKASSELLARDPDNRLLARGPRTRLSAEMVRDQALAASGLLVEQLGGPSIKPYQPEGLWDDLQSTEKYVQDHGSALYRRGMYVFWKRTIAPPIMVTFDAAGRETCIVRETRTNTPLQALTLLNEVSFVEAARKLAERTLTSGGTDADRRLRFAFRAVLTREPSERELIVLRRGLERHLANYREHPAEAIAVLRTGESAADTSLDPVEVAAWTAISGLILNLDEAVTKE
ncbi:MAG: DUF1553 domain-containing protein [Planctomycetaceae bacterium]